MSKLLNRFYNQPELRQEVYDFLMATLQDYGGELAMRGEDTKGIKDAAGAIEEAFNRLEETYGQVEHKELESPR